jgi:hypothetical protein
MTMPRHAPGIGRTPIDAGQAPTSLGSTLSPSLVSDPVAYSTGAGIPASSASDAGIQALQIAYRQRQLAIALAVTRVISAIWQRYIVPEHMADSWAAIRQVVQTLIGQYSNAAAADSAQFYEQARVLADLPSYRAQLVQLPQREIVKVADSQAMGTFFHNLTVMPEPDAATSAGKALEAGSSRLALKSGRHTITEAVHGDKLAVGWERLISPGACSFCSMLASRGAVYRSQKNAQFSAHDHCHCTAQPIFEGQSASSASMDLAAEWQRVTRGKSGANARKAWQQYWEGRNGTGDSGTVAKAQEDGAGDVQRPGRPQLPDHGANGT